EPRVGEVATPEGVTDRRAWLQQNFPWRGSARRLWADLDPTLRDWRNDVLAWARGCEQDCAVFSHFIAINVIVGAAAGGEATIAFRPDHASITEITSSGGRLQLVRLGAEMSVGEVL